MRMSLGRSFGWGKSEGLSMKVEGVYVAENERMCECGRKRAGLRLNES